jgi:cell division protein FtsL
MSIRLIAKDLYRITKEIEALEERLKTSTPQEADDLKLEIQRLRAERERLKKILEGHKSPPPYRLPK